MRLREWATKLDAVLVSLAEADARGLARSILTAGCPPTRQPVARPSADAWRLAYELALSSIEPLALALDELGPLTVGNGWQLKPPHELPKETLGLPLLAATSTDAVYALTTMQVARTRPSFAPLNANFAVRLSELIAAEDLLWSLAARQGGRSGRIPYAYRFQALEWFWTPSPGPNELDLVTVCLRCGALMVPRRRIASPPRCGACADERNRAWPSHAIAPAEQGTWWLRCLTEGCRRPPFEARRDRLRCPSCTSSKTTPSKRRPLTESYARAATAQR